VVRRLLPLVLAGSLLVAACAGDSDGEEPTTAAPAATTSTEAVAAADGTTTSASIATTTTAPGRPPTTAAADSGPTTTLPPGEPTELAPGSATAEPTPADDGRLGPPGAYARTMLRPRPATTLVVERFHQSGAEPGDRTMSRVESTLRQVTKKDVEVRPGTSLDGAGRAWTAEQLRALADASSRVAAGGSTAVLKLLFLLGSFEGDRSVLGVAVRGDVVVVFSESVDAARTPVVSRDAIEEAVVIHELGHVLGLVDLARDSGRADPEHPGHSPNSRSVMYWAVESSLIGQVLSGPPPREFDEADLADLEALRNGA